MPSDKPIRDSDQAIRTVSDLDPDREVYHSSRTGGPQRSVHLDDECRFLDTAKQQFSSLAGDLDDERDICQECAGSAEYGVSDGTDVQATRKKLSSLEPDDVGLTPIGERSPLSSDQSGGGVDG